MNIINTIRKLFILILSFLSSAGIIPAPQPPADGIDVTLDYKYADSDAGCAAGTLTLKSNFDSDSQMYWAYEMQSYNPRINITDYDGTTVTMVHISSVAAPRTIRHQVTLYRIESRHNERGSVNKGLQRSYRRFGH